MNCSCPKCDAGIPFELDQLPEGEASRKCPECQEKVWTKREPFALRAYRKEGKIYCRQCGSRLGHANLCLGCGAIHPAYVVVQLTKPVTRKVRSSGSAVGFLSKSKTQKQIFTPSAAASAESRRSLIAGLGALALVVVLAVVAGMYYRNHQSLQNYSRNYVRALYGIKSGADRNLELCAKTSAGWRKNQIAGENFDAGVPSEEANRLAAVKAEIDKILVEMGETPEKFSDSRARLDRLYGIYAKLHALNFAPPKSLPEFSEKSNRLQEDFERAAQELKANLSEELRVAVREAVSRYKNLRFIVDN